MRILVYWHNIGYTTETFIYNEVDFLNKAGHEVLVIGPYKFDDLSMEGYPYKKLNHYKHRMVNNLLFGLNLPSFYSEVDQMIKEFKPDLIHFHFGTIGSQIINHLQLDNFPIVVSFHGYDASQELSSTRYLTALKKMAKKSNVHAVICSNALANNLKKADVHFKEENIIPYGINVNNFNRASYDHPKDPIIMLQISSIREKKGHIYTLQALKKVLERNPNLNIKLILTGGGDGMKQLQPKVEELGLTDVVEFVGWVNHKQAVQLLEKAHIFVHHSVTSKAGETEGMPNAIIEAVAMELPVLSTYHAGIPEVVENETHGFLVKERDVEDYADKMEAILSWDYLKENKEYAQNFSRETHGQCLVNVYKKALESHKQ